MDNYWVHGIHAVKELLINRPNAVTQMRVLAGRKDNRLLELIDLAEKKSIAVIKESREGLNELTSGNHQGVAVRATLAEAKDEAYLKKIVKKLDKPAFFLVLDGVTDPHNLGACLRSADGSGVTAVIVPKDNSAPLNAIAHKVACGAAETVPLIQVVNLARTLKWLRDEGIWLTGLAGEAKKPLYQADLTGAIGLVLGSEGQGLRRLTREQCDFLVKIPLVGAVSSLNVSVAAGVSLFEAARQRSS